MCQKVRSLLGNGGRQTADGRQRTADSGRRTADGVDHGSRCDGCCPACHLVTCHLVTLSPVTLSPVTLSPCHLVTCHLVTLSPCHLSPCHLSPCHLSPCHLSPCHLSPCHLSPCHPVLFSYAHRWEYFKPVPVLKRTTVSLGLIQPCSSRWIWAARVAAPSGAGKMPVCLPITFA
jgi:hypothetical protein